MAAKASHFRTGQKLSHFTASSGCVSTTTVDPLFFSTFQPFQPFQQLSLYRSENSQAWLLLEAEGRKQKSLPTKNATTKRHTNLEAEKSERITTVSQRIRKPMVKI